jgi:hypothetical protein
MWERGLESSDSVLNTCDKLDLPVYEKKRNYKVGRFHPFFTGHEGRSGE